LQTIQLALLDEAVKLLKPGGILVYSTCTVDTEENRGTAEKFMNTHPQMEQIPAELPAAFKSKGQGFVQVFPQDFGSDGFFIASFRKTDGTRAES